MIWFDNLNVYGSANYYVQKLFSLNTGTHLLSARTNNIPNLNNTSKALTVNSTFDEKAGEVIIKVVNASTKTIEVDIELDNVTKVGPNAKVIALSSEDFNDENSLREPKKIYPQEKSIALSSSDFKYEFQPYSFTILRIPVEK